MPTPLLLSPTSQNPQNPKNTPNPSSDGCVAVHWTMRNLSRPGGLSLPGSYPLPIALPGIWARY